MNHGQKVLDNLIENSIPIYYVRFHQPVPTGEDKEPVAEFRLKSSGKQAKYLVDDMAWTPDGVIYFAFGETNLVPLANVIYARLVKK